MKINLKKNLLYISLFIVIVLGLGLRFKFFSGHMKDLKLTGDAQNYHIMSRQIVDDHIYGYALARKSKIPNAYVTPGYPLFLSAVYAVVHDPYRQITVVRLLQILINGLISPVLAFLLIRRIFKRRDVAVVAALFMAVYPTYIQSTMLILTEVLSLATMLLYFYLAVVGMQEKKTIINIMAGAAFALHILVRPAMLPLYILPFIYAFFTHYRENRKELAGVFLYTTSGFIALMLPWWVRNLIVMGKLILTATGSENPLLAGTYPYMQNFFIDYQNYKFTISQSDFARKRIIEGFTAEPLLYLKWYTIGKLQYMFKDPWLHYYSVRFHETYRKIHGFFVWFGLLGVIINSTFNKVHRYINIYGILFLGLYLIFIPVNRYMYQHMFFLMLAAAYIICIGAENLYYRLIKFGL